MLADACLPTGPAATVASAPILNLSLIRLCKAWSFMNSITTSVKEAPIWKPTLPPPTATNIGALQPLAVRQVASPLP